MISDIAAISGIWRAEIPIINGSNPANEHFSGSFRQHDNGFPVTDAHATVMNLVGLTGRGAGSAQPFSPPAVQGWTTYALAENSGAMKVPRITRCSISLPKAFNASGGSVASSSASSSGRPISWAARRRV